MSHPARKLRHIRAGDSLAAEDDAPWWHAFVNGTHSLIEHAILTRGARWSWSSRSRAPARVLSAGHPFVPERSCGPAPPPFGGAAFEELALSSTSTGAN